MFKAVVNCDTSSTCSNCQQEYLLLHRVVASAETESRALLAAKRKARNANLPLWQRCYHCGYLTPEGAVLARKLKANELNLSNDLTADPENSLHTPYPYLLFSVLLLILWTVLSLAGVHGLAPIALLIGGTLGFVSIILLIRSQYYTEVWDPTGESAFREWKLWWEAEGKEQFHLYGQTWTSQPWMPKVL